MQLSEKTKNKLKGVMPVTKLSLIHIQMCIRDSHYQVLTPGVNKATYLIASPFAIDKFADIMQSMAPAKDNKNIDTRLEL